MRGVKSHWGCGQVLTSRTSDGHDAEAKLLFGFNQASNASIPIGHRLVRPQLGGRREDSGEGKWVGGDRGNRVGRRLLISVNQRRLAVSPLKWFQPSG